MITGRQDGNRSGWFRWNRWSPLMWAGAAGLLLLPLVAMRFTDEVAWDRTDFLVMGVMLALACGGIELAMRTLRHPVARAVAVAGVVAAFLLTWVELAVGILPD